MTCYGTRHVWAYVAVGSGQPPHGMTCICGVYTWVDNTPGVLLHDGVDMVALADVATPDGRCPRCKQPWDDHRNGACPRGVA